MVTSELAVSSAPNLYIALSQERLTAMRGGQRTITVTANASRDAM